MLLLNIPGLVLYVYPNLPYMYQSGHIHDNETIPDSATVVILSLLNATLATMHKSMSCCRFSFHIFRPFMQNNLLL